MADLSVFLCYTPFHVWVSTLIRGQYCDVTESENLLVAIDAAAEYVTSGWTDVWTYPSPLLPGEPEWKRQLKRAKNASDVINDVRSRAKEYSHVRIHYSHLEEYVCNNLIFRALPSSKVTYFGIPDGLLNYYELRVSPSRFLRQCLKTLVALRAGFLYRPFRGLLTGFERPQVVGQYAFRPQRVAVSGKAQLLSLPAVEEGDDDAAQKAWLIIGQEAYYRLLPRAFVDDLIRRQLRWVLDRAAGAKIYYKPHHFAEALTWLEPWLETVSLIKEPAPVEQLISSFRIGRVVAFNSSALLHIAYIYDGAVQCYAVGFEEIGKAVSDLRQQGNLADVFRVAGVKIASLS